MIRLDTQAAAPFTTTPASGRSPADDLAWRGAWHKEMEHQQAGAWLKPAAPAPAARTAWQERPGTTARAAAPAAPEKPAPATTLAERRADLVSALPRPTASAATPVSLPPAAGARPAALRAMAQVLYAAVPGEAVRIGTRRRGAPPPGPASGGEDAFRPADPCAASLDGPRQPVRLHVQWGDTGAALWLGLDAAFADQAPAIARQLQRALADAGMRLASVTCNGAELALHGGSPDLLHSFKEHLPWPSMR
jgi:hypothetical protein